MKKSVLIKKATEHIENMMVARAIMNDEKIKVTGTENRVTVMVDGEEYCSLYFIYENAWKTYKFHLICFEDDHFFRNEAYNLKEIYDVLNKSIERSIKHVKS